jgi:parvulin-like peptidyl-prolyl isomerase
LPRQGQGQRRSRITLAHLAIALAVVACGGKQSADADAKDAADANAADRGAACLADAAASRDVPADAPDSIEVAHVLVRHADLERPEGATRSREEACLRALEALEALQQGAEWEDVVGEFSDAAGATAGNLGTVARDDLAPEFADAAFALDVNQLSYVVETDRGFHIIVRLE